MRTNCAKSCPVNYYRFFIYHQINLESLPSPFLTSASADPITRFRFGSHNLLIETGRWRGISRKDRLCTRCKVLGDECHFVFHCSDTVRNPGHNFPDDLGKIWKKQIIFDLFKTLSTSEYLKY